MKSTTKKVIRKLAKQYPPVHEVYQKTEFVRGKDLSDAEIKQIGLPQFRPELKYKKTTPVIRLVNHVNGLQKFYKLHGPDKYQNKYNLHLKKHVREMTNKYPEVFHTAQSSIPKT